MTANILCSTVTSFPQFTPNAIITAPKEIVKLIGLFPPVLDSPSKQVSSEAMGGAEKKKEKRSDKENVGDCVAELFSRISPEPTQNFLLKGGIPIYKC